MPWLDWLVRDPVPWLLDPENPSARYLTLGYILKKPYATLSEERARILNWSPIQGLFQHWNRFNFWGRVYDPYFGGSVGNFGTLYLLAQLGAPLSPELQPVCENLLDVGRRSDGRFSPQDTQAAPWLCYTGMALKVMWHFGYGEDLRTQSAWEALIQAVILRPELLSCPMVGARCRDGLVKALDALSSAPTAYIKTTEAQQAMEILVDMLSHDAYDWDRQHADWLNPTFPRYYGADIIELCRVLAQTPQYSKGQADDIIQRMLSLQTEQGRWRKMRPTPALNVERIYQPSRWLTFEAIYALTSFYGDSTYAT